MDKLGLQRFRIQLHLAGEGPETLASLQQFCERHPNVVRLARQLGAVRFEVDAEVEDFIGFNELVDTLRDQLGGQLREIDYLLVRKEHLLCFPDLSLLSNSLS